MSDVDPVEAVAASVKDARRLVTLTIIIVSIAVVVLWIDQGIKRSVITEAQKMRGLLDELKTITLREAASGTGAGEVPAGSSDGANLAGHVDDAPGAPAAADLDARGGRNSAGGRSRGTAGRPRRDGQ